MQLKDLKLEIIFLNQKYNFIQYFKNENNKILNKVRDLQDKKYKLNAIKKYIFSNLKPLYNGIKENILDIRDDNRDLLTLAYNYNNDIDINDVFTMGFTINELIQAKIYYHMNLIIRDVINNELKVNAIKKKTTNSLASLTYDFLKSDRLEVISKIESNDKNIKGWLYSSILDRKTSNLCISLNNRFYSGKVYKTRSDLPYRPNVNTHPNCRSMLITIYNNENINDYKGLSIEEFIKNDKYEVKKLIGVKKYKLMIDNNLSFNEIFNYKNNKFYTNTEIKAKIQNNLL